jgi:hypothetical protein
MLAPNHTLQRTRRKRLASANGNAKLRLISGMNHLPKHATSPAEQRAAHADPSLPIEAQALGEIAAFVTTETARGAERSNPAFESGRAGERRAARREP